MSDEKYDPMALWDQVCKTDMAYTKKVNQRGGFTAIDAQYQIREATKLWGPYGGKWGVKDCEYGYFEHGENVEIWLRAVFFCPEASFSLSTDHKWKAGDDNRKKLLTDLTTKALSKLGFNADIFLGMHDGNKYTGEKKEKVAGSGPEPSRSSEPEQKHPEVAKLEAQITETQLKALHAKAGEKIGAKHWDEIRKRTVMYYSNNRVESSKDLNYQEFLWIMDYLDQFNQDSTREEIG